ncbi:LOW QUALITY PROTEIN: testis-expressed protein 48 [Eumetopias jubatus]|uniref:LOW QUALITY PROTEIN: testis-expressed protein 48 n=1 Tax=Eumetopias jubatus TaxID=34886 RepID=UPI001016E9A3|nr:LOW QUALITY PROTEIN: testis-expressed protein 48 [Eumetopias jubatus]
MAPIPLPPPAAHQSLASKIFCLCCRDCEEPCAVDDSKVPSQTQEPQPSTCSRSQTRTPRLLSRPHCVHPSSAEISSDFLQLLSGNSSLTSGLQKEEVASKNSNVDANEASRLPLGQPLIHPEKRASSTSNNEYEKRNTHVCPRGFYKRNLNCYSQDHWPFQPCHIGRP